MTTAIIVLIIVILLILLLNAIPGLDGQTANILRVLIIGAALVYLLVEVWPGV